MTVQCFRQLPWLALLLAVGPRLQAQDIPVLHIDTVRAVQPWHPHETYSFPRFALPERPVVAARINRDLCIDFLDVDPDTAKDMLFANVWGDTVGWTTPQLSFLEWSVRRPFAQVLQVELSGEGCGAYCEGFTMHYQFDLRTGRRLEHDSLFMPQGIAAINDTLLKAWTALLNGHMAGVVDSLADTEIDPEYVDFLRAELEMYRRCLVERTDEPYVVDLVFEGEGVRFFLARCASHVEQALDELDPVSFTLRYSWLHRFMRPDLQDLFPGP